MRLKVIFILLLVVGKLYAQQYELKNLLLINYYNNINKAEKKITENEINSALDFYKEAFKSNQKPHAKDIYNSMQVAIQLNNKKIANKQYQTLKCLKYNFEDDFLFKNKEVIKNNEKKCEIIFNVPLIKTLDSLMVIDQKYRLLSGGNYAKYKKELTESDSIVSTSLAKLIEKNGFPNEYDISLDSANGIFSQKFYTIIWHQMSGNTVSPQRVNFSPMIMDALNKGKITPQKAEFLIDLNDGGQNRFDADGFAIHGFLNTGNNINENYKKTEENIDKVDCCYVYSYYYFPEKRNEKINMLINRLNENRSKIGLCNMEEVIAKNKYYLDHKDFIFQDANEITHGQPTDQDIENYKKRMFMIKIK